MGRIKSLAVAAAASAMMAGTASVLPAAIGSPLVTFTDLQVNASSTRLPPTQFQGEPSIAQNPTNPLNLVVGAFHRVGEPECTDATPSVCPGDFPLTDAASNIGFFA